MKRKKTIECSERRRKDCGGWIDRINFGRVPHPSLKCVGFGVWPILRRSAYSVRFLHPGRFYRGVPDDFSGPSSRLLKNALK